MLLRNKIQGVAHGLKMKPGATASRVGAVRTKVEASYPTPGVPNMPRPAGDGILSSTSWGTEYLYYMTGLLPAASPQFTDSSPLIYMFRDMYLYDSVAGAAIDIQSTFPFSDFELRGLPSKELRYFWDSIERLNLRRMMPEISIAHLTDGFFCGSLIFDPKAKQFMDVMVHDALQCSIEHNPFYNADPTITVTVPPNLLSGLSGGSTYLRRYLKNVPEHFLQLIMQGKFIIDPLSTLYIPRKGLTDRAYVSYLQRVLPMYLVEKAMFRGTLTEAHRRQRAMTHITVGDGDVWVPEDAEIEQIVKQFMVAEQDPLGGWIGTRDHVQSTDLRPAGDFWKWTDMVDTMVDYKLRALGISEAFLSGDASYACLTGDTLITKSNGSKVAIKDMCPVPNVDPISLVVGKGYPLNETIPNRVKESAKTKAWIYQGKKPVYKVTTKDGNSIKATDNHPFFVLQPDGTTTWKHLSELKVGDKVAIKE